MLIMKIAVLFDGAGLARLGLEQCGHDCVGYEICPRKHQLSQYIGSGNCVMADVLTIPNDTLKEYDAIWASPPCQFRSGARPNTSPTKAVNLLNWCLKTLPYFNVPYWIENVVSIGERGNNDWGFIYNAAQFLEKPIQNRNRVIGGIHKLPKTFHPYKRVFPGISPCITATEYKARKTNTHLDRARASRWHGHKLSIEECAYYQGLEIPEGWKKLLEKRGWSKEIYEAIGNGVPVYMSKAFGEVYVST